MICQANACCLGTLIFRHLVPVDGHISGDTGVFETLPLMICTVGPDVLIISVSLGALACTSLSAGLMLDDVDLSFLRKDGLRSGVLLV